MGYVKSMLPDDWEPEPPFVRFPPKTYLCIGNNKIKPEWLPRWYGVPHEECLFIKKNQFGKHQLKQYSSKYIVLKPLPKNSDYKQHLKMLKTEKLLNGI